MSNAADFENLQQRLQALEDEKSIRHSMNTYMHLCDQLDVGFSLEPLMNLFSDDAIWEGKGSRYAKTFGRYEGRSEINAMFAKYTTAPAHFSLNVHVLGNELIDVNGDTANGSWVLVQPSDFSSGKSQLSCARISAAFTRVKNTWLIQRFQTENLFSRPMAEQWNQPKELPVPE